VAGAVAGASAVFKGSVSTVISIAPPAVRGEALAGLLLAAYMGLAVPVVGLGLATELLSARDAVLGFAAVLVAVVAVISRGLLRQGARQPAKLSRSLMIWAGGELGTRWLACYELGMR
jgi:hypothetical protein